MIDCGLTVELGESDHKNLVKILGSLIKRDGYAAGKLMVDTAKKCQATELDVELFCKGIEKICRDDEENVSCAGFFLDDLLSFSLVLVSRPFYNFCRFYKSNCNFPPFASRTFLKVLETTSRTSVTLPASIRSS